MVSPARARLGERFGQRGGVVRRDPGSADDRLDLQRLRVASGVCDYRDAGVRLADRLAAVVLPARRASSHHARGIRALARVPDRGRGQARGRTLALGCCIAVSADLGAAGSAHLRRSGLVVLSVLAAQVPEGRARLHDGRDRRGGLDALPGRRPWFDRRRHVVGPSGGPGLGGAASAQANDGFQRFADAAGHHGRLRPLLGGGDCAHLRRYLRAYGLEDESHDHDQRHLPSPHCRLVGRHHRHGQRNRRRLGRERDRPYHSALFLSYGLCHHGIPAPNCDGHRLAVRQRHDSR